MQPYVLFVNHPKCRDMKIKKSGYIKKNKAPKGNNKIIKFRRCSKINTSDRITKKTRRPAIKKQCLRGGKPQQQVSIRSSSGRKEKFDTDRMAQTIDRSGVPLIECRTISNFCYFCAIC